MLLTTIALFSGCFAMADAAPATTCVTNGAAGALNAGPKKGQKVPAGTPCTGWYRGKKSTNGMCQRTGYDWDIFPITHYGWCGVEAAPGTNGTYSKADAAWGACARTCRPVWSGKRAGACEKNNEGIGRTGSLTKSTLSNCQKQCESKSSCRAIDFYTESGWCNFFNKACTNPLTNKDGASSYILHNVPQRKRQEHAREREWVSRFWYKLLAQNQVCSEWIGQYMINEVQLRQAISADECAAHCLQQKGCTVFIHSQDSTECWWQWVGHDFKCHKKANNTKYNLYAVTPAARMRANARQENATAISADWQTACRGIQDLVYGRNANYGNWISEFQHDIKLLEAIATRHKFNYSIGFGTMLASLRHGQATGCGNCIIPYDNDADVWVAKRAVEILLKLAGDPSVPSVVFNKDLTSKTDPRYAAGAKIVMYPLLDFNPWNPQYITSTGTWKGRRRLAIYPPRWTCSGKKYNSYQDQCGFDGPVGRIIKWSRWIDIFPFYANGPKYKGGECTKFRKGYVCNYFPWNVTYMRFPETEPFECNGVKTRRFKDVKLMHELASSMYGQKGHMRATSRYKTGTGWYHV